MPTSADVRAMGEFAASHYGTFTTNEAAASGISANALARLVRDGAIIRERRGVFRFRSSPVTHRQQLYAATLGVRVRAADRSAAAVHVLDGFEDFPETCQLVCHHDVPIRIPGATVRKSTHMPRADTTVVDGIPCTTIERTVIDLAPQISHGSLVRLVDDAQRRGTDMERFLDRATKHLGRGRRGPRDVVEILRRRQGGYVVPESVFERLLAECLRSELLAGLVRQHELRTPEGLFVARFDFALPWVRLGIEAHSRRFHLGELVESRDEARDIRAAQQGWDVTYLGFAATRAPAEVRRNIELIVEQRARDFGLAPPGKLVVTR